MYFPPVNVLSKQKRAMSRGMRKPRGLKVRWYVNNLIELNGYLAVLPEANTSDRIFMTELNKILLNSIPNLWIKHAHVQVFDCEFITKKAVNMFERTEILESIYEDTFLQ